MEVTKEESSRVEDHAITKEEAKERRKEAKPKDPRVHAHVGRFRAQRNQLMFRRKRKGRKRRSIRSRMGQGRRREGKRGRRRRMCRGSMRMGRIGHWMHSRMRTDTRGRGDG